MNRGALAAVALSLAACAAPVPVRMPADAFLFAYFTGNGEDGLHLCGSRDGLVWHSLARGTSVLPPRVGDETLLRDPSVVRGPDGLWHVVWTCGWHGNGFAHAATSDFVHWTAQRFVPAMAHEPTVRNVWAPDVLFDDVEQRYVIVFASTIPGRFPATDGSCEDGLDHRLYVTTTRDWLEFSRARLLVDPGFPTIDGSFARRADGERFLLVKDETLHPVRKQLRAIPAAGWTGPFGAPGEPFTASWCEGPCALHVGDEYLVYFDRYRDGRYGCVRTMDFERFEDVSDRLSMPSGARHGCAFPVPVELLGSLEW